MTRKSKLALVTLLAVLLSLVPVSAVSADSGCAGTGYAPERCEIVTMASDDVIFRITEVAAPAPLLTSTGVGQEHYEATIGLAGTGAGIVPVSALPHVESGMAPEHFAQYVGQ